MNDPIHNNKRVALSVLEQIARLGEARGNQRVSHELREEMQHLRAGELNVVVVGECKRGKSSLINALLGEPDLCPPDAPVATNAITAIRYGERERITVHLGADGEASSAVEITRAQIRQFVTEQGNEKNQRRVRLVQIELNNPKLKDGLVLIDTPGVGSLNVEHTAVTFGIIPHAHAVLFVGAADEPLGEPELRFLERVGKHSSRILHVLTKRGRVTNWPDVLRDNLDKMRQTLKRDDLDGVAVSSLRQLEYLASGDEEALESGGFQDLERGLWALLDQRWKILQERAQDYALHAIADLRLPAKTEHDALSASSAEELKTIDDELQKGIARAEKLVKEPRLWTVELDRRIGNLTLACASQVEEEFLAVERKLATYLENKAYLEDPRRLGEILTADSNSAFVTVVKKVEDDLIETTKVLCALTTLGGIDGGGGTVRGATILAVDPVKGRKESLLGKGSAIGRSFSIHAAGLGTAGALTGAIIGGIIGTLTAPGVGTLAGAQAGAAVGGTIAAAVGGIFGIKRGIDDLAQKELADLRQKLGLRCKEELGKARRIVSAELKELVNNARSQIHASMIREIDKELSVCKDAAAVLSDVRRKKHSDLAGTLRNLSNTLKLLDNLESAALALGSPADASGTVSQLPATGAPLARARA